MAARTGFNMDPNGPNGCAGPLPQDRNAVEMRAASGFGYTQDVGTSSERLSALNAQFPSAEDHPP